MSGLLQARSAPGFTSCCFQAVAHLVGLVLMGMTGFSQPRGSTASRRGGAFSHRLLGCCCSGWRGDPPRLPCTGFPTLGGPEVSRGEAGARGWPCEPLQVCSELSPAACGGGRGGARSPRLPAGFSAHFEAQDRAAGRTPRFTWAGRGALREAFAGGLRGRSAVGPPPRPAAASGAPFRISCVGFSLHADWGVCERGRGGGGEGGFLFPSSPS